MGLEMRGGQLSRLTQRKRRYRELIDAGGDAIFHLDTDGRFLFLNEPGARRLSRTPDEVIGRHLEDFIPEAADLMVPLHEVVRTGSSRTLLRWATTSGRRALYLATLVPVKSADGAVLSVFGVAHDVTERKRLGRALLRSHRLLRSLVTNMGEGVGIVDADECFEFANPAAHSVFGVPAGSLKGRNLREFVTDASWQRLKEQSGMRMQGQKSTYELGIVRPDGQSRIISVTATPRMSRTAGYQGAFGVFTDVTEQREIEAKLQKTSDDLEVRVQERTQQLHRLIGELQEEIQERQRIEQARLQTEEELRQSRERLRQLAASIESNREEETRRIAREIHDELGQNVTAAKFGVHKLKKMLASSPPAVDVQLDELLALLDSTFETVRRIAQNLRPPLLDHFGLPAAIECLAREFQARTGVNTTVQVPADLAPAPDATATAIFRICQEALTNVARHANAQNVEVGLKLEGRHLFLEIADDGKGFAGDSTASSGLGLVGMEERALRLGGRLTLSPGDERRGTRVLVTIPLASSEVE